MNIKSILLFSLVILSHTLPAQNSFCLQRYKPDVVYYENGKLKGPVFPGFKIGPKNDIEIKKGGWVWIADAQTGKVKVFADAERYSFVELRDNFKKEESFLSRVLNVFGIKFTEKHSALSDYADKHMEEVYGGTSRDFSKQPMQYPPPGCTVLNNTIQFKAKMTGDASCRLIVFEKDVDARKILLDTAFVQETLQQVKTNNANSRDTLYWECSTSITNPGSLIPVWFRIAEPEEAASIKKQESKLRKVKYTNEAEKLLTLASFYESKKLFYEADVTYKELVTQNNSKAYEELYAIFLAEWGIVR